MLEDTEEDVGLITRMLRKENFQFTYKRVDCREEFIESLDTFAPDIILSDHSMPQFNSIEALQICQESTFIGPFILVTGAVSDEFAVMCIKQGADDYVLKSNLSRLPLAIKMSLAYREQETIRLQQQNALKIQNEELIKINKELDAFVYSASHNLRAPLSSILGLTNLAKIESSKYPEMMNKYFTMIEQSVLKLDDTIKDIIDYSKNSRNELIITKTNIENIIENAFEQLKFMNGFHEIKRSIKIQDNTELYTDEHRLKVIISNLISNSIKYRDKTKKQQVIDISVNISSKEIKIELIDNGIGIPVDLLPKIFDMFFRGTNNEDGSGLGLYIVKEMINRLNGKISVNSKTGEGTSVTISLPNYI